MRNKMTRKELSMLTQKQLREYAVMKGATKVPKKWADKTAALNWLDKNGLSAGAKVSAKKVLAPTKVASIKPKKKETKKTGSAIARREAMVALLKTEPCTVEELAAKFGNKYKSVLDDLHAIRHNRNTNHVSNRIYLKNDEVLVGVFVGKSKAFQICKSDKADKVSEKIKKEITLA